MRVELNFKVKIRIRVFQKVKDYFKDNLGAPFLIGFQAFLLICTEFLVMGNPGLAEVAAVYAYYLLIVGVLLQLISYILEPHYCQGSNK